MVRQVFVCLVLAAVLAGCASNPVVTRWVRRWERTERRFDHGDAVERGHALAELGRLQQSASTPVDRDMILMRRARFLERMGYPAQAVPILVWLGQHALRRMDRARAHYELMLVAERAGQTDAAKRLDRRTVLTYPALMEGPRSLQNLQRIAEARGLGAVDAHLGWTLRAWKHLGTTQLGDNILYYAAHVALRRFERGDGSEYAAIARRLYLRLARRYTGGELWQRSLWELSYLDHRQRRWTDEIDTIRRIQRARETSAFMGDYESAYYWVGQLRIARLQLLVLHRPDEAASTYQWFIDQYPESRWRDDALFWQGCAYLHAGDRARANASFSRIHEVYAESKYLRRLDAARAHPQSAVCDPEDFAEGTWG